MFTILFFDEANSTEAIGTIKEIMCDLRMNGKDLEENTGLKIIAACNPYKKHSDNIIHNFEKSGLGFYVDMNETQEKLGDLPMRHLVYRVQPLPASMLPIIWDFGQLSDEVEILYITQIVTEKFSLIHTLDRDHIDLIIRLLACSQIFMREQKNECSFVSLRDIQRVLKIIDWFLHHGRKILNLMNKKNPFSRSRRNSIAGSVNNLRINDGQITENEDISEEEEDLDEEEELSMIRQTTKIQFSFGDEKSVDSSIESFELIIATILALNTCYHVGLQSDQTRKEYREKISEIFMTVNSLITPDFILEEINYCYEIFLDEINLPDAIARNQALKENVFMMIMCVELKIPLFIIGKPGSSKSLAKTLISRKMQGSDRAKSAILNNFKESHLITFQCSPLSTSEMILNTFRLIYATYFYYYLERE